MNILDRAGILFFKEELIGENSKQIKMFEGSKPRGIEELGRIRLYEEKIRIERHFKSTDPSIGVFLTAHPSHGLLGKTTNDPGSSALIWKEEEGIRHSIKWEAHPEMPWVEQEPPKARLTPEGKVHKKAMLT
jgi:hypothetical protein